MTAEEARTYLNFLMTLCLRREQAFAPLALKFVREHDMDQLGLLPGEQVNLLMALAKAYADEPIACNIKVWFDAARVNLLLQGAPDLHDYGLHGASGLVTRTYGMEKTAAYVESFRVPWQEGLSFNFVNIHVQLSPGIETAFVPYNTPIFSVYPVLSRQSYEFRERREMETVSTGEASAR